MADEKITWFSQPAKTTIGDNDTVMVYDGTKTYTVPFSAFKKALPSSGGTTGTNWYETTKKLSPADTDLLPVYDGSDTYIVPVSSIKGVSNVTDEHLIVTGRDGKKYRVGVDYVGNVYAVRDEAYTATPPNPSDNTNDKYQALIINQMWGGGEAVTGTAVSHSFIELYNLSGKELNLKGLYLWYKSGSSAWEKVELIGVIPPYSSYLVRGAQHNSEFKDDCRLKIKEFDLEFKDNNGNPKKFSDKGMSVYISIGDTTPDTNPLRSTTSLEGAVTFTPGYVDLMGCGGTSEGTDTVTAYEKNYRFGMNKNCACRRVDFYNGGKALDISGYSNGKGDNANDCEIIDYSTCDVEKFRPRTSKEGNWDMFVSKDPINENAPNAFILGYGEKDTTRTFTWQSKVMKQGYVKYREQGQTEWITVQANTSVLQHPDCTVSKHSAIIPNLQYGKTYEYKVGAEGYWSDEAAFNIVDKTSGDLKILWLSDVQSWTEGEMQAFKNVFHGIKYDWHSETQSSDIKLSEFDFYLDTGDISQNGRRRPEYYWWFDALEGFNKTRPIMACMGNNDLLNKMYGQCFANFFTNENQWANSVYHFMVGKTEFICLNSNTDYDYVTGFGSLGDYQSTDAFLLAQAQWLDNYLTTRQTNPTWTIVFMHLSPFTCVRTKRCQVFTPVFEKHKIPLVLCGHNHLYTRSIPVYSGYTETTVAGEIPAYNDYYNFSKKSTTKHIDEKTATNTSGSTGINHTADKANGTYYVMCPSSGWKNSGKETHITEFSSDCEEGYDYNANGHSDGRVWWNEVSNTVKVPGYLTIKISETEITLDFYQIQNAKMQHVYNGTSYPYAPETKDLNMTRTKIDSLTIRKSDRN